MPQSSLSKNSQIERIIIKLLRNMKVTIVGDTIVGKTCLIHTFIDNKFYEIDHPTVFEEFASSFTTSRGELHHLTIMDTTGDENSNRLRSMSYLNTDVFLLCYAVNSRCSFDNIYQKWMHELNLYDHSTPIILVATKSDLFEKNSEKSVTTKEGKKMSKRIQSFAFVECSAKTQQNLQTVFEEAIRAVEEKNDQKVRSRSKKCEIS